MSNQIIRISLSGGIAEVVSPVPKGITVIIQDFDINEKDEYTKNDGNGPFMEYIYEHE